MATPSQPQSRLSTLLCRLPSELRLQIFRDALIHPKIIAVQENETITKFERPLLCFSPEGGAITTALNPLSPELVGPVIASEAAEVFYGLNTFSILITRYDKAIPTFFPRAKNISPSDWIRNIIIEFNGHDTNREHSGYARTDYTELRATIISFLASMPRLRDLEFRFLLGELFFSMIVRATNYVLLPLAPIIYQLDKLEAKIPRVKVLFHYHGECPYGGYPQPIHGVVNQFGGSGNLQDKTLFFAVFSEEQNCVKTTMTFQESEIGLFEHHDELRMRYHRVTLPLMVKMQAATESQGHAILRKAGFNLPYEESEWDWGDPLFGSNTIQLRM